MDFAPATAVLSGRISPRCVILGLFSKDDRFDIELFLVLCLSSFIDRSLNFAASVDKLLELADALQLSLDKSKQKISIFMSEVKHYVKM